MPSNADICPMPLDSTYSTASSGTSALSIDPGTDTMPTTGDVMYDVSPQSSDHIRSASVWGGMAPSSAIRSAIAHRFLQSPSPEALSPLLRRMYISLTDVLNLSEEYHLNIAFMPSSRLSSSSVVVRCDLASAERTSSGALAK